MPNEARDPRRDPKPDDIVAKVEVAWIIVTRRSDGVSARALGSEEEYSMTLKEWREWATNAEVKFVAAE